MAKQLKWMGFVLVFLIAIYAINSTQQKKYNAKSDLIFDIDRDDVFALEISTASEYLKLKYDGETWSIDAHDSLTVKTNTIGSFFNTMISLKKTSLVSKNPENWDKFMVGDSTGTHLKFIDYNNEMLSKIVVGRSNAEWSTSNIRIGDSPEVYHTSENVSWQINPSPSYWGEVVEPDSANLFDSN